jgi:sterol desaturase/sphingolipid hydroxylase (fatty acid hydroxylase superfamily)
MIHRKHHTFRQVRPVSSEYAHPLENLLNLIAMYAGLVIMGSSFVTWAIWVTLRIYETNDGHSGYEHNAAASRHAYHHQFPTKGCYGTAIGFWDRILGTDKNWREWKAKERAKAENATMA